MLNESMYDLYPSPYYLNIYISIYFTSANSQRLQNPPPKPFIPSPHASHSGTVAL